MGFFKNLFRDNSGATAIEYGLIAALVAVALIAVLNNLQDEPTADSQTETSAGN